MRILLSNDDGINAPGMAVLEQIARTFSDDITVVAPLEEQSGKGRSLTITQPVRMKRLDARRYAVAGTPTDAVMLALAVVMKDAWPDLILSGVNRGANLAEDVSYSGTVAAAMEGAFAGVRSVALSQVYPRNGMGDDVSFATAEAWGAKALAPLLDASWAPRTLVNINFPPVAPDKVRGIRAVGQGLRDYGRLQAEPGRDPRGYDYHWLTLGEAKQTPGHDTDLEVVADDYVSVTPLHLDLTHRASLDMLARLYG